MKSENIMGRFLGHSMNTICFYTLDTWFKCQFRIRISENAIKKKKKSDFMYIFILFTILRVVRNIKNIREYFRPIDEYNSKG